MYARVYACMRAWIHACLYIVMYICTYICMYACMYVCMYAYVCIRMHAYTISAHCRYRRSDSASASVKSESPHSQGWRGRWPTTDEVSIPRDSTTATFVNTAPIQENVVCYLVFRCCLASTFLELSRTLLRKPIPSK